MKITRYTNNMITLEGRVSELREYSPGKAANVTIAVENAKNDDGTKTDPSFIQTKSFSPAAYGNLKKGMKIRIYGHIVPSRYVKNGETTYSQDIVADYIEYLESKATVEARSAQHTTE